MGITDIWDVATRFVAEERVKAFLKGNETSVLRYFSTQALNSSFNDYFKESFLKR